MITLGVLDPDKPSTINIRNKQTDLLKSRTKPCNQPVTTSDYDRGMITGNWSARGPRDASVNLLLLSSGNEGLRDAAANNTWMPRLSCHSCSQHHHERMRGSPFTWWPQIPAVCSLMNRLRNPLNCRNRKDTALRRLLCCCKGRQTQAIHTCHYSRYQRS